MRHETIAYQADGLLMRSQLFYEPASTRRAGVLVFPEAFGLGEHVLDRAKKLAELGYVTLACDLHGEGRYVENLTDAMALLQPLFDDPSRTRLRALGAFQSLLARPEVDAAKIGAIGFCFPMPLELARSGADVKAVVGFHTGLTTNATRPDIDSIKARILVCIGADDPFITADQRSEFESEMRVANVDWQMNLYGDTVHSFTNKNAAAHRMPETIRYSPAADKSAWQSMLELFAETLGTCALSAKVS